MMHQLSALFYPVGLALIWRRSRENFWRDAALYTLISAGGTLTVYALAYKLAPHYPGTGFSSGATFVGWLTFHASIPFAWHAADDARWLMLGTARLFGGGKLDGGAYFAGPVAIVLFGSAVAALVRRRRRFLPVLGVNSPRCRKNKRGTGERTNRDRVHAGPPARRSYGAAAGFARLKPSRYVRGRVCADSRSAKALSERAAIILTVHADLR